MDDSALLNDVRDDLTGFLYSRPSLLDGAARVLDMGGTLAEFNTALSEEQADYLALRVDWLTVGRDIRRALDAFGAEVDAAG